MNRWCLWKSLFLFSSYLLLFETEPESQRWIVSGNNQIIIQMIFRHYSEQVIGLSKYKTNSWCGLWGYKLLKIIIITTTVMWQMHGIKSTEWLIKNVIM